VQLALAASDVPQLFDCVYPLGAVMLRLVAPAFPLLTSENVLSEV
jgi:hypothetical protein